MFYNEYEIEDLTNRASCMAEVIPYAQYLSAWVQIVNSHSDGWAYWRAGSAAGCRLADLIKAALGGTTITRAQWNRAIGSIKTTAARQLKHGNTIPLPEVVYGS